MDKDCVTDNFNDQNTNGQTKSLAGHWEDGEQYNAHGYLETVRKSDQLFKIVPALQPPQTNAAVNTLELAASHKFKGERRRKMTTPRKVCTQEEHDEGDRNISQRPLFTTLKPQASHMRTATCGEIKKARRSAVCHRQASSNKKKDKAFGRLEPKRVSPSVPALSNNHTPVPTQPETSSRRPTILQRKKWGSVSPAKKITAAQGPGPAPHLLPAPPQTTPGAGTAERPADTPEAALMIHGLSVEEYRNLYHSVVDPRLCTASGNLRRPNLELGRVIKQRLWERLCCPRLQEEVLPDGRVTVTETFCHPAYFQHAPLLEVDVSDEPAPEHTDRRRTAQPKTHRMGN